MFCFFMLWFSQSCEPILHLADAFIQSDLQCIQAIHFFFNQYVCSLGIEPFALLTQCSTTEPQEHTVLQYCNQITTMWQNLFLKGGRNFPICRKVKKWIFVDGYIINHELSFCHCHICIYFPRICRIMCLFLCQMQCWQLIFRGSC